MNGAIYMRTALIHCLNMLSNDQFVNVPYRTQLQTLETSHHNNGTLAANCLKILYVSLHISESVQLVAITCSNR